MLQSLLIAAAVVVCSALDDGLDKTKLRSDYGYITVREGAHMFWWLEPVRGKDTADAPLIIWLQGGPGASSTGFGNFQEVGPFDVGWRKRKDSWVEEATLLFIDNPVGTGFSYVEEHANLTTNNSEIVADLMAFLKSFLHENPKFRDVPLHIISESYGGKMAAGFALAISRAVDREDLKVDFRGVALGDSWISPVDYVLAWAPFLKAWSLLGDAAQTDVSNLALRTQQAVGNGNLTGATALWAEVEGTISNLTDNVDWYNALLHNVDDESSSNWLRAGSAGGRRPQAGRRLLARYHNDALADFMNGDVRRLLGDVVPEHVTWGGQSQDVFDALAGDFMVAVIDAVDALLAAGVPVTVHNGQLDLICCTLGTDAWMDQLRWTGMRAFRAARAEPLYLAGRTAAFHKRHAHLQEFIILEAGHMIPSDQPRVALEILLRGILRGGADGGVVADAAAVQR